MTKYEAIAKANDYLKTHGHAQLECAVVEHTVIECPKGWIMFYNTRKYLETGDFNYDLGGNGPLVVSASGELRSHGPLVCIEELVADLSD